MSQTSQDLTDEEYAAAYPFVVVHEALADGAWATFAYATMREALTAPRHPGCQTPTVFGSWADYEEWKHLRLVTVS